MPAARARRGWCPGCLQKDEPPEITYCVVDAAGALSLHALTPTQPMPPQEELEARFAELVEELDLTAPNKTAMLSLPVEKKWQIYCSRKGGEQEAVTDLSHDPDHYIQRVNQLAKLAYPEGGGGAEAEEEVRSRVRALDGLKTALRTQPHSFVLRFIELQGLPALLAFLQGMDVATARSPVHTALIGCIKALMNNSTGRAHVLAHPTGIDVIAQSLAVENVKTKVATLEILGAVCLVPGGHKKVLAAMTHYQQYAGERARFQGIVNELDRSTGAYRDDVALKTAVMSFINAVLSYGAGLDRLEFRLHLRYELLMLGVQPAIDKLRRHENETLDRHLDFFEMVRNEDEKELARKFSEEHIDTKSATSMFDLLRRKLSHTAGYPHLLSLLHHLLLLPLECGGAPQHWLLLDRVAQQICLQTDSVSGIDKDPDVAPLDIDVRQLVQELASEEAIQAARRRAEELERENADAAAKLAAREAELDRRQQEKEDLELSLSRCKERLEKETSAHLESRSRLSQCEQRVAEAERAVATERGERQRLERLLTSGSIPDDAKVLGLRSGVIENSSLETSSAPAPAPPPPPPPCGMMLPPPPPPALPPALAIGIPETPSPAPPPSAPAAPAAPAPPPPIARRAAAPQPSAPLKSFNWSKLPDTKVAGTIWSELDESKLYASMELEAIDRLFCAYQKNGVTNDGSIEDLRQLGKGRSKILSVIDGRRAQNCTILLSKLKMSDEDISKAILGMDARNQLPIDMVELLLHFIPSAEEAALLEEHADALEHLARADRFLYEISKIPHYEQRLRALHYKKRFGTWATEASARAGAVLEASREVARSRRLRKLLELVLALGNYVNRGARGNAAGFRLASLNRLADTKSSALKGTTLLHYLVDVLDKKFKDTLRLAEDLPHVREAAKVNLAELEKDMAALRAGLKEVEREVDFHRSQPNTPVGAPPSPSKPIPASEDLFVPVMREFLSSAAVRLSELEDLFQDMKNRFERAVRLFGEEPGNAQPDAFFGIFDAFLTALQEARQDNEALRRRREEEERRAAQELELKKRTVERKGSRESKDALLSKVSLAANGSNGGAKGEFDDLISALRTGDVFGDDVVAKFKQRGRHKASPRSMNALNREDSRERVLAAGRRGN